MMRLVASAFIKFCQNVSKRYLETKGTEERCAFCARILHLKEDFHPTLDGLTRKQQTKKTNVLHNFVV